MIKAEADKSVNVHIEYDGTTIEILEDLVAIMKGTMRALLNNDEFSAFDKQNMVSCFAELCVGMVSSLINECSNVDGGESECLWDETPISIGCECDLETIEAILGGVIDE